MSDKIADVLERAAARVERGWTRGHYARDARGRRASPRGRVAVAWCAEGAIAAEYGMPSAEGPAYDAFLALSKLLRSVSPGAKSVYDWNDAPGRTQAEVVAALREAARRARSAS
jgi:hypothetical protein